MNSLKVVFVIVLVFVFIIAVIWRLIFIQIDQHKYYSEIAEKQQNKSVVVLAERGTIKDRNSQLLAYTKNDVDITIDKRMLTYKSKKEKMLFEKLSETFGFGVNHYLQLINRGRGNVLIEHKIPKVKTIELENFGVGALKIEENHTRIYPYGKLASHIIGYVNSKNLGISGIESKFNDELKGVNGIKYIENDVIGRMVTVKDNLSRNPKQGNALVLTIDINYQNILETYLAKGMAEYEAKEAVGIIMNPQNGEILALANFPDYEPAKYNLSDDNARRNRAVTDSYEPGSTMKPIVMSALLNMNLVKENDIVYVENGVYNYKNVKIRDTHKYNSLTVKQVIEHSSNIGMAKLSERIDKENFYKVLRDFGFGNFTGISFEGEVSGRLKKPSQFTNTTKAFMSFGYEMTVTPIQLITAYAALINGGNLFKPMILKKIEDQNGNLIKEFEPVQIRKVISEKTSEKIKEFMVGTIENGTAKNAKLSSVKAGGKTGTSQKLIDGGYSKDEYNTSFVGFFPADNPQFLCLIIYGSPQKAKYGGLAAAPVFKEIAEKIIELEPESVSSKIKSKPKNEFVEKIFSDVVSKKTHNAEQYSDVSTKQTTKVKKHNLGKNPFMPNVVNLSMRSAVVKLKEYNLHIKIVGNGKVISQSIEEGKRIKSGDSCILYCKKEYQTKELNLN
jgi:cell division protein FtsI (penicillin-binding protein 3)